MPELPEVETVRRGLEPVMVGRRFARVEARRPDLRFPLPQNFAARLSGACVEALQRRAKYLLARLDRGETLVCHLGMTGRFTIVAAGAAARAPGRFHHDAGDLPAHTHVIFETDAADRIEYADPRRFGYMDLIPTAGLDAHPFFAGLGPEPLGAAFNAATLAASFDGRAQSVKAALLDQRVVAGLGNIYVCEALHRAGIAPDRPAGRIARRRLAALVAEIRAVLEEAIAAGGSTLRDYAHADGALGYFQHGFRVYGRAGAPCLKPGCDGVVARLVQNARSTFHCPLCQR